MAPADSPGSIDSEQPAAALPEWAQQALDGQNMDPNAPDYCKLRFIQHSLLTSMRQTLAARAQQQTAEALTELARDGLREELKRAAELLEIVNGEGGQ